MALYQTVDERVADLMSEYSVMEILDAMRIEGERRYEMADGYDRRNHMMNIRQKIRDKAIAPQWERIVRVLGEAIRGLAK